jgi:hypothetical protein
MAFLFGFITPRAIALDRGIDKRISFGALPLSNFGT